MDSGRNLGWSGRLDWPPAGGRHRRAEPAARGADPLVDTMPVGGLHKFDLGMVPASVTPPRSWRQAAWFAIASSVAALGGLLAVTTLLSDNRTAIEGMELPSMPRGRHYAPIQPTDRYFLTGDPTRPEAPRVTGSVRALPPVMAHATNTSRPVGSTVTGAPGSATESTTPTRTSRPPTSEASELLPFTDTATLRRRGNEYYAAIGRGDLASAYSLTAGKLRSEGYEAFAARYSYARKVEVIATYVTPVSTMHTLRLTHADGSVHTERRELRYTSDDDPMIISDEQIG